MREIREEVGIEVKNIRYFGSQPWPFPNSLMIAYTAEYAEGEIELEKGEISRCGMVLSGCITSCSATNQHCQTIDRHFC